MAFLTLLSNEFSKFEGMYGFSTKSCNPESALSFLVGGQDEAGEGHEVPLLQALPLSLGEPGES